MSALNRLAALKEPTLTKMPYPHLEGALAAHTSVYRDGVNFLLDGLTKTTSADGHQFAGYAPVLEAVATVIASESNPAKIGEALKLVLEGRVLGRVTSEVMIREAGKLAKQISVRLPDINTDGLYGPEEQLSRLASLILGAGAPKIPPSLPQHAVATYESAVQSLLPQHPFLDSKEPKASGAVFAASILAAALTGADVNLAKAAERFAGGGPHTPNPFLLEFYLQASETKKKIPESHVGLLYASLEATAGAGDSVRLSVDGRESLEIEMSIIRPDGTEKKSHEFSTASNGTLRFGRRVSGVSVDAEEFDIEIGDGGQLEFVAPVDIRAKTVFLNSTELVIKPDHAGAADQIVFLEAKEVMAESSLRPPLVRTGVTLNVAWPDSKVFPWTPFASDGGEDPDPRMADAQRALRRLCLSFRSHSKGRLARFKDKVEHFRMTKGGLGVAIREKLLGDGVLKLEGTMYFLESDALGQTVGLGFQDLKLKHYPPKSRAYLQAVLDELDK